MRILLAEDEKRMAAALIALLKIDWRILVTLVVS